MGIVKKCRSCEEEVRPYDLANEPLCEGCSRLIEDEAKELREKSLRQQAEIRQRETAGICIEQTARSLGWSEEANTPPWSWVRDEVDRLRTRPLFESWKRWKERAEAGEMAANTQTARVVEAEREKERAHQALRVAEERELAALAELDEARARLEAVRARVLRYIDDDSDNSAELSGDILDNILDASPSAPPKWTSEPPTEPGRALNRACLLIAECMGSCPLDRFDAVPWDADECSEGCQSKLEAEQQIASCWRRYFLADTEPSGDAEGGE